MKKTKSLDRLVNNLYSLRQQKKAIEQVEKDTLVEIKAHVDRDFEKDPKRKMTFGNLVLSRQSGTNTSIKAERLLEKGVSPEIIDYATQRTSYFQYPVKPVKEGE